MSYFQAVRIYSAIESVIFAVLLVVWIGGMSQHTQLVIGWIHGIAWICLSIAVAVGCRRGVFPWPLLAATVSPLGPFGCTAGIEVLRRQQISAQSSA